MQSVVQQIKGRAVEFMDGFAVVARVVENGAALVNVAIAWHKLLAEDKVNSPLDAQLAKVLAVLLAVSVVLVDFALKLVHVVNSHALLCFFANVLFTNVLFTNVLFTVSISLKVCNIGNKKSIFYI